MSPPPGDGAAPGQDREPSVPPGAPAFAPGLYVVAGPIGNLEDITLRALRCLREADLIVCEDTRHSQRLLGHYDIRKPLLSLHAHNEAKRSAELLDRMRTEPLRLAYLSDAGSPAISDPGERLIHRFREAGFPCDLLPGPSAVTTAVAGAGLSATPFCFMGFLPVKKGQRLRALESAIQSASTTVFFESPHRLTATLDLLAEQAPEHLVCVARELTKRHQEYRRGPARDVARHFADHPPKGEITLVLAPAKPPKWLTAGASGPMDADPA